MSHQNGFLPLSAPLCWAPWAAHLAAAQLSEPDGFAAKIIATAGLHPSQVISALGTGPAESGPDATPEALLELPLDEDAHQALNQTMRCALRLGHNYIGTEHILLGLLTAPGPVREAFAGLGLSGERAEQMLTAMLTEYQARMQDVRDSLGRDRPAAAAGE